MPPPPPNRSMPLMYQPRIGFPRGRWPSGTSSTPRSGARRRDQDLAPHARMVSTLVEDRTYALGNLVRVQRDFVRRGRDSFDVVDAEGL